MNKAASGPVVQRKKKKGMEEKKAFKERVFTSK